MEMKSLSQVATIHNNAFLKWVHDEAKLQAQAELLDAFLKVKFGDLPDWAIQRLKSATPTQMDRRTKKLATAVNPEKVLVCRA